MIDRIREVRAEVENVGLGSRGRLMGTATVEYNLSAFTFSLSRDTLKTLEELIERDADVELRKMLK